MDSFESILDESISALQAGIPIEEILAEVPEYATELRPLLFAATLLADPDPALVPQERKLALRAEYMKQVAELPELPHPAWTQRIQTALRLLGRRLTPKAILNDAITIVVTMFLTLLMVFFILNYLAIDTVPGDFLYNIKRTTEQVRLTLTSGEDQQQLLLSQFNENRLEEIQQLITLNRAAVVEFQGVLETKSENLWVIEGYTVSLPQDILI
ncbi:MAG: DUF5667 domain-containing protein, partial [Chloroflexota bacterium]